MTRDFVRTWIDREELRSTSDEARSLVHAEVHALPLLVSAKRQTAGRGRGANSWWSDEGSLTFTIGLDPAAHGLASAQGPRVALAAAVAVIEAVGSWVPAAALGIRWPNDVEAQGRKLAGILPELVQTAHGPRLLVGIGLNVCTTFDAAPAEVIALATSLALLAGRPLGPDDQDQVLRAVVARFAEALAALARGDLALSDRWNQLDLLAGQQVRILQGTQQVRGVGSGIDAQGGLRLWSAGEMLTLFGGQVLRTPQSP